MHWTYDLFRFQIVACFHLYETQEGFCASQWLFHLPQKHLRCHVWHQLIGDTRHLIEPRGRWRSLLKHSSLWKNTLVCHTKKKRDSMIKREDNDVDSKKNISNKSTLYPYICTHLHMLCDTLIKVSLFFIQRRDCWHSVFSLQCLKLPFL